MSARILRVTFILALSIFVASVANAGVVLLNNTHTYGDVVINVEVVDQGSTYLWQYTVNNIAYNPVGGNGFSGFELNLPVFVPDIANITGPALWNNNCCSGFPVEWDLPAGVPNAANDPNFGTGLLPGDTGVFSFTTLPRNITNSTGWYHTWSDTGATSPFFAQTSILYYDSFNCSQTPGAFLACLGPEAPDLLKPPIPEPTTMALLGTGIAGLLARRRRRTNV